MARLSKEHKKTLKSFIAPDYTGPKQQSDEPGLKFDGDKAAVHLFPSEAILGPSIVFTYGAIKYAVRNWERGMSWSRPYGALLRHLFAWWEGSTPTKFNFLFGDMDNETGYSHLWHAGCCLAMLIAYESREMVAYDDRPVHKDLYILPKGKAPKFSWRKK